MAASGVMDHSVAGSFASRISDVRTGAAAENIAAGTKTWPDTLRAWQASPGHNANLLQANADSIGVAVARNDQTRYKTYCAMVIAEKTPNKTSRNFASGGRGSERREGSTTTEIQSVRLRILSVSICADDLAHDVRVKGYLATLWARPCFQTTRRRCGRPCSWPKPPRVDAKERPACPTCSIQ